MNYELICLGLVCLAAPWFAKMAGYETYRKPFDFVGVAGIFFLLGASFVIGGSMVSWLVIEKLLVGISFILGWISLALGALWGAIEVIREPEHGMTHKV